MLAQNPRVSLCTRNWLWSLIDKCLDEPCYRMLLKIVYQTRWEHPGGAVYEYALELGASGEHALVAGSAAEIFYAACSAGDDIQDGDASEYMECSYALQLNAQAQLMALVTGRIRAITTLPQDTFDPHEALVFMLTGQRMELCRGDDWNVGDYMFVARASAGMEYRSILRMAVMAYLADNRMGAERGLMEAVEALGVWVGMGLQLYADARTKDERLFSFSDAEIAKMKLDVIEGIRKTSDSLTEISNRTVKMTTHAEQLICLLENIL